MKALDAAGNIVRVPPGDPAIKGPYQLADPAATLLGQLAKENCRCKKTGISQWRQRGRRAVVCKCALPGWLAATGQSKVELPPPPEVLAVDPAGALIAPDGTPARAHVP